MFAISTEEVQGLNEPSNDNKIFVFVSMENEKIEVPRKIALMSQLAKTVIEGDTDEKEIPFPTVKTETLKRVIEYMTHYADSPPKEIEKPLKTPNLADAVTPWDNEFVNVDKNTLYDLITASNYMDVKPLLELACAKVAAIIKEESPETIKKLFSMTKDLTPEEEAAIKAETEFVV
jgi:S-phase kinase-associated protein 1